jgi:hypothetical protein
MGKVIHIARTDTVPPRWVCDIEVDPTTDAGYRIVDQAGFDFPPEVADRFHRGMGDPVLAQESDSPEGYVDVGGRGIFTLFPKEPGHVENACRSIKGFALSSNGRPAGVR